MTEPRPLLGGRYSLERPMLTSPGEDRWMAIEAASGRLVVVGIADPGRLSTLSPARDVRHRHLATVTDVINEVEPDVLPSEVPRPIGAGAAVAEHVPGRTLHAVLEEGPLHPAKAVAWVLRLAEAVHVLHSAGAVHGAISPRSVIAEPRGRAIAPVLAQLVAPPIGPYCPPERLRGAAESSSDDVWGLMATLYAALTGRPPYVATTREALLKAMLSRPTPLSAAGVSEPVLEEIILRGLMPDRRGRVVDLAELQGYLDGWEREPNRVLPPRTPPRPGARGLGDLALGAVPATVPKDDGIVIDDTDLKDDEGRTLPPPPVDPLAFDEVSEPPLVPAARPFGYSPAAQISPELLESPKPAPAPAAPRRRSINPFERKRPLWPWLLVAGVGGGGVTYLAFSPDSTPAAAPIASSAVEAPSPSEIAPRPAAQKKGPEATTNACVRDHFAPGSFEGRPDFAFVCDAGDFPAIARRLGDMVVSSEDGPPVDGAPLARDGGAPLKDGGVGSELGWYELPATAIIRKTCCPNAPPVVVPETKGWCEQIQAVLRRMEDESARAVDLAPAARTYQKAVNCIVANHGFHPFAYSGSPSEPSRIAFQQFLGRAAILSTKR